jgi:NAD-dependent dihydropyrimidine dehydrogenase PreA subunit
MKATRVFFAGLVGLLLSLGTVQAQLPPEVDETLALPPERANEVPMEEGSPYPRVLSNWITYNRPNCCQGPVGGSMPIGTELFIRSGPSIPFGSEVFGTVLDVGWMFQGGARALFFDQGMTKAWTVDASISNHKNRAGPNDVRIPLSIIDAATGQRINFGSGTIPGVTVRGLNRTFVNFGLGREYYLWHPANHDSNLRVGVDGGIRYGTCKADFYEIRHRTDVIGGTFAALHSDLEIPCGCCIFQCGLRGEWAYTWSDILQKSSEVHDVNFLVNLGVRY